jgi:hypothetical protein
MASSFSDVQDLLGPSIELDLDRGRSDGTPNIDIILLRQAWINERGT